MGVRIVRVIEILGEHISIRCIEMSVSKIFEYQKSQERQKFQQLSEILENMKR